MSEPRYDSIYRPDLFSGRVSVITGGGSGIGRCIAHELASLGATVVLASRDLRKTESVRDEIQADGGKADAMACDIRSEEQVRTLVQETIVRYGRLDFLVNNGGGQFAAPLENTSIKGWHAVIETNLTGTFLMSRETVTQHMREHGGSIVNIVADMWKGMPMMGHSGAARAGVVNLTMTSALEWAQYGIRVNAVAPGVIRSSGFKNYPPAVLELLSALPRQIPARRFGTESEVSAAVVFLLSPGARYVNGTTLRVDGGSSLALQTFTPEGGDPHATFHGFHRESDLPDGFREGAPK